MSNDMQLDRIERALVALRRRQRRSALARLAEYPNTSLFELLDAVEAAQHAGAPATVSIIAVSLNVDQPRASKLVGAAVKAGLVHRQADQADGRRTLLLLTPKGHAETTQAHEFRRRAFARAMADWTADERAQFARLLGRFVQAMDELTPDAR
jgi:DNA-binding MarR family transcriptional regulator